MCLCTAWQSAPKRTYLTGYGTWVVMVHGKGGLLCECLHAEECDMICRHILATCRSVGRYAHLLKKPIGDTWLNSNYCSAFKDLHVKMPSQDEIYACSGDMYPANVKMQDKVNARGRPRVKRLKSAGEMFRRKMRHMTADGPEDKRRQCSCCRGVGHMKPRCPVRNMFKKP